MIDVRKGVGKRFLNEYEAAKYMGLAVSTLRNWRWKGKGPVYHKLSRSIRYDLEELDIWLESKRQEPMPSLERR